MRSSYNKNFTLRLALVDGYIANNQFDDALSSLKKAQKSAYSAAQRLSVIKRYRKLGASAQAEKFLLASMKKLPDSVELAAVYVQTMLDKGDLESAAKYASKLKGSWFDSLYVETCLRQVTSSSLFYEDRFSDMYKSAWKTTGDERWLRNSAVLLAAQGNLKDAARLHPGVYSVDEEPYFWALLDYDAENYNRCIEGCNFIIDNMPHESEEASLICSDAWLQKNDIADADAYWLNLIDSRRAAVASAGKDSGEKYASPIIYKNAAHYAVLKDDYQTGCELLVEVTKLYPDYVPGLVAYVNFAITGDKEQKEYEAKNSVFKSSNMKTLAMAAHDAIPRIPLEEAMLKLEDSLYDKYDQDLLDKTRKYLLEKSKPRELQTLEVDPAIYEYADNPKVVELLNRQTVQNLLDLSASRKDTVKVLKDDYSSELLIEYTRVCWQMQNTSETDCHAELWSLLEETRLSDHYEPYMVRWATSWLCSHHNETEGRNLFQNYLKAVHGPETPVNYLSELEDWECELAAWFALRNKDYDMAQQLYEYRLNERETLPDSSVLMNCAAVYTVEHNLRKALDVYSTLAPMIEDPVILSEVQYRIGVIQYDLHEKRNALLSLTYSVKLNPDNHRARLLLKQIE